MCVCHHLEEDLLFGFLLKMANLTSTEAENRIRMLEKQRQAAMEATNRQKEAIARESERVMVGSIESKFTSGSTQTEEEFTRQTTGFVTAEQFRQKKKQLLDEIADAAQDARKKLAEEFVDHPLSKRD